MERPGRRAARALTMLALLSAALTGCSTGADEATTTTTTVQVSTSTSTTFPVDDPPALKVTELATLDHPTAMAQRDGNDGIYVAEKTGRVRLLRNGVLDPNPVLDLSHEVSAGSEQGLLGLAFAPGSSQFYVDYTDKTGDTHITELTLSDDDSVDLHTRREILTVDQPYDNHNGGQLAFGPDKMLYIGLGDGGSAGDPKKNGQDLTVLLGKILRIDPKPSKDLSYTVPFDNPFAKQSGARGEIWAYGLRNPWRFSFDRVDGNIWIADVGQNAYEEIDTVARQKAGVNYGWSLREGTHKFSGDKPNDAVDPVFEYNRDGGACSITGGYSYRGNNIPGLVHRYVYADYCTGKTSVLTLRGTVWQSDPLNLSLPTISSFGEDHHGELYVLLQSGQVGRIDPA